MALVSRPWRLGPLAQTPSLRWGFSLIFTGNIINAACQWAMMVVLVKCCSPEMVGQFGLGLAVSAPVMMLVAMQLRTVLATDQGHEFQFRDYLTLRLIALVLGLGGLLALSVAAHYRWTVVAVILAVGVWKAIESADDILQGLFQKNGRMNYMAASMALKGILSLAGLGVIVAATQNVLWGVLGMIGAVFLVLVGYDIPRVRQIFREVEGARSRDSQSLRASRLQALTRLTLIGIPLGFVVALNSLNLNIPRYLLEGHCGERELGIFSALAAFMRLGAYVETALAQAALPTLSRLNANGRREQFRRVLWKLISVSVLVGITGVIGSLCCGRQLLAVVYASEYAAHASALHLLMVAAGVGYVAGVLKVAVDATRTFRVQFPLFLVSALLALGAGWALIPKYGIVGAALTAIAVKTSLLIGYLIILLLIRGKPAALNLQ